MTADPHRPNTLGQPPFSDSDEAMWCEEFDDPWALVGPPDPDDEIDLYVSHMCAEFMTLTRSGDEEGAKAVDEAIEAQLRSTRPWLADTPGPRLGPRSTDTPS